MFFILAIADVFHKIERLKWYHYILSINYYSFWGRNKCTFALFFYFNAAFGILLIGCYHHGFANATALLKLIAFTAKHF
jgi:hypothetical protein